MRDDECKGIAQCKKDGRKEQDNKKHNYSHAKNERRTRRP
jgi:hypothetical protein